jgi:hypothetical protein
MNHKTPTGTAMIVQHSKPLAVIEKPLVNVQCEILFMPTISSKAVKLSRDEVLTAFSRVCFVLAGVSLMMGYGLSALSPI